MKKIIIDKPFFDLFPDAEVGVVIAKGIDNNYKGDEAKYRKMLDEGAKIGKSSLNQDIQFSDNDVIQEWRKAYQQFKTKKGARSSIEALLKRVNKGDEIRNIDPLVDIYNAFSMKYQMPCGAEDIDKIQGNMLLTAAKGDEKFITYGSDKSEPPYPGEIIYKDDKGAICRCLNWREGERTIIDDNSKNAELCVEQVNDKNHAKLETALKELADNIKTNLGGTVTYKILTKSDPEIEM